MTRVSTPYESIGRTEQKRRTRDALVTAARDLVASGVTPTIEQAASAAGISRTAAYRYFPNRRAMLAAAHPETDASSLLPPERSGDAADRLDDVVRAFTQLTLETEAQLRTMLRLSLEADDAERAALPLRQGRAIGWIREALEPLSDQLSEDEITQLVRAIRSAVGIESLVWLTDVARLPREDAARLMAWSASALLHAALTASPPPT